MIFLSDSVGKGGRNYLSDVKKVQDLLNASPVVTPKLVVDQKYGPKMYHAILQYQMSIFREVRSCDGLIEANGKTLRALNSPNTPIVKQVNPIAVQAQARAIAVTDSARPFVYADVDKLENTGKVGSKQCVALLQYYAKLPQTTLWKAGEAVVGNQSIAKGTAIATFVDGKYQSHSSGNHAAFYLSQDSGGIWIMDQWADDVKKPFVSKRYIRKKGISKSGQYADPSNNADAYSVIK